MAAKNSNLSNNGTPKSGLPAWLANYEGPAGERSMQPVTMNRRYDTGPRNMGGKPTDRYSTANFPKVDNSPIPDDPDQILRMLQSLPKQPAVDMGMGWSSAKQHSSDIGARQRQLTDKARSLGMDVSYSDKWNIKPMTAEQLAARDTAKQTQGTKPGDIKIGPGGLPPEFRNKGNIATPADFKPGFIMPTEAERQAFENHPNFIKGLPPGMNPAGTPSAAWNAPQSPQQPNSRPIQSSLTGTPPPKWDGSSRGPESLRYQEWLRANPNAVRPEKPQEIRNTGPDNIGGRPSKLPSPFVDDKGNKPPIKPGGGIGSKPYPMPPWGGGDNPYTPEFEQPNNRPPMQRPSFGADTSVTPEFNYTDPKKFKKEMLNLKQDIREAQADGDTDKLNRLIDKQNRANYTVQGLNAGLSQEEAARYAKREADIDAKAKAKGGAGGRIEEPGTLKSGIRRKEDVDMEDLQRRANGGDQRAQIEVAKQQPANNFTGKSPYARTTPEESWALEKAAAAGDKRAKDEIALRKQTKDETGNHTLSMSRPALDSLHGLKGTPAQIEAAELVKNRQGGVPTITPSEAQRLANGTPEEQAKYDKLKRAGQLPGQDGKPITPIADPVNRGPRTADFQDRNRDGIDDRDQGNNRNQGGGGGGGGKEKPDEKKPEPKKPPQEPPGRGGGGGGGGGRGNRGPQPRETAKERNARLEAEADSRRDAQYKADERQRAIDEGYSTLDPLGSKKFFEGNKERKEKEKAEADQKRADAKAKRDENSKNAKWNQSSNKEGDNPYASIPKLSNQGGDQGGGGGELDANGNLNLGLPQDPTQNTTYTPGSPNTTGKPLSSNNTGWSNGGGMGGGQGGGGGGGNSGSGGRFVTINGQVRYFG